MMNSLPKSPRRPTYSLAALFVVVTLTALVVQWPRLLMLAVPIFPYFLTNRFLSAAPGMSRFRYGLILAAIYLPAAPGFFSDCSHCRKFWWEYFPITPGVVPAHLTLSILGFGRLADWMEFTLAAILAAGAIAVLYLAGSGGKVRLAIAIVVAATGSSYACLVLSALLRA